jgi:tRNA C32,U32 (ribose-2'-O)-methylase TrmJ
MAPQAVQASPLLLYAFRVVCVSPSGALNVGMIARACANFDVGGLAIVAPEYDRTSESAAAQERQFATMLAGQGMLGKAVTHPTLESALQGCSVAVGFTRRRGVARSASANQVEVSQLASLATLPSPRFLIYVPIFPICHSPFSPYFRI